MTAYYAIEGPTGATGPAGSDRGTRLVDARDKGAVVDGSSDCAPGIQAALDALVDPGVVGTGRGNPSTAAGCVTLPTGTAVLRSPVWCDGDYLTLAGDPAGGTTLTMADYGPAILLLRRRADWDRTIRDTAPLTGTATFTAGSAAVAGSGAAFRTELTPGCKVKLNSDGTSYTVASIQSETALTLTATFAGTTATGATTRDMAIYATIPATFAADHRPDAFGKLDTSAAAGSGQCWGLATKSPTSGSPYADHFLSVQSFPPATGLNDQWLGVRTLVVDFCVEGPPTLDATAAGPPQGGPLFGMGDAGGPSPWLLDHYYEPAVGHRVFRFIFKTNEGVRDSADSPRVFTFGNVDTIGGPTRVTVQLDFTKNSDGSTGAAATCAIRAWQQSGTPLVEQAVTRGYGTGRTTATGTEPSFTAADGLHWRPNKLAAFHVGTANWPDNTWQASGPALRGLFTLYGLHIGMAADYTSDGSNHQARADAGTLNDAYRYLGVGRDASKTVARLGLQTAPTADYPGRLVRFVTGSWNGGAGVLGVMMPDNGDVASGKVVAATAFRDIAVRSLGPGGVGVLIGPIQDVTFDRVSCYGGYHGIAGYVVGANYDIVLRGCSLVGTDAWYVGTSQIVECDGLSRQFVGNAGVRLSGCDARFGPIRTGGYTNHPAATVEILDYSAYTSQYEFTYINVDQEGGNTEPAVYCEKHRTGGTLLRVKDIYPGIQDGVTPMVKLVDHVPTGGAGGVGFGMLRLRGNGTADGLVVECQGDWRGTVEDGNANFTARTQYVKSDDATVGVMSIHYLDDLPNNLALAAGSKWTKNGHIIYRTNPPSGGWSKALCTGSGTVGGSPAPTWTTFDNIP